VRGVSTLSFCFFFHSLFLFVSIFFRYIHSFVAHSFSLSARHPCPCPRCSCSHSLFDFIPSSSFCWTRQDKTEQENKKKKRHKRHTYPPQSPCLPLDPSYGLVSSVSCLLKGVVDEDTCMAPGAQSSPQREEQRPSVICPSIPSSLMAPCLFHSPRPTNATP